MAVGAQDILTLLVQELHQHGVLLVEVAPEGELWLQDDAEFIGCDESGFGGAPTMETYMVQTVGCTGTEVIHPRIDIHSDMSCERPYAGIVFAPQEYLVAIGIEVLPLDVEVLEVRVDFCVLIHRFCLMRINRQFHSSDDTVPVSLGVLGIGVTVGIDLFRHSAAVIHHDGELVLARGE